MVISAPVRDDIPAVTFKPSDWLDIQPVLLFYIRMCGYFSSGPDDIPAIMFKPSDWLDIQPVLLFYIRMCDYFSSGP